MKEYRKAVQFEKEELERKDTKMTQAGEEKFDFEETKNYLSEWQNEFLYEIKYGFDRCKNTKECIDFHKYAAYELQTDRLEMFKKIYGQQAVSINSEIINKIWEMYTNRINAILCQKYIIDPPKNIKEEDLDDDIEILHYKEKGYEGFHDCDWEKMEKIMNEAPAKREQARLFQKEVRRQMNARLNAEYEDTYGNPKWRNYR
jgi:hypothetical protein